MTMKVRTVRFSFANVYFGVSDPWNWKKERLKKRMKIIIYRVLYLVSTVNIQILEEMDGVKFHPSGSYNYQWHYRIRYRTLFSTIEFNKTTPHCSCHIYSHERPYISFFLFSVTVRTYTKKDRLQHLATLSHVTPHHVPLDWLRHTVHWKAVTRNKIRAMSGAWPPI